MMRKKRISMNVVHFFGREKTFRSKELRLRCLQSFLARRREVRPWENGGRESFVKKKKKKKATHRTVHTRPSWLRFFSSWSQCHWTWSSFLTIFPFHLTKHSLEIFKWNLPIFLITFNAISLFKILFFFLFSFLVHLQNFCFYFNPLMVDELKEKRPWLGYTLFR